MNPSHPDSRGPAAGAGSSDSRNSSMRSTENQGTALGGCLLAILPVASFLIQYSLSLHAGTLHAFFHHLTVMVVDWVFVPFNFFVVKVIDWGKGGKIFVIACISVALNALTHAYWQYNGLDFGHMITRNQIVLPAGWVHLAFSTIQMMLLVAFVFCRNLNASVIRTTTAFATAYFSRVLNGLGAAKAKTAS